MNTLPSYVGNWNNLYSRTGVLIGASSISYFRDRVTSDPRPEFNFRGAITSSTAPPSHTEFAGACQRARRPPLTLTPVLAPKGPRTRVSESRAHSTITNGQFRQFYDYTVTLHLEAYDLSPRSTCRRASIHETHATNSRLLAGHRTDRWTCGYRTFLSLRRRSCVAWSLFPSA